MNKTNLTIAIVIIIVLLSFTTVLNKQKNLIKLSERKTITIADFSVVSSALLPIALERGYFDNYGLNVKLLTVQTGDEALKAVASKNADVALAAITPYSFLAIEDPGMKIFVTIASGNDGQIIARKDRGIFKQSDLKGKKVGYTKTSISELGLEKFLKTNGLQKEDIQWINLKPIAMPTALISGDIDAYSLVEPHLSNSKKALGDKVIIFNDPKDTYSYKVNLIAEDSYINNNKDTLERLVKALIEAEKFVDNNKNDSVSITANHINIPVDTLNSIWTKFEFKVSLESNLTEALKDSLLWANNHRETKNGVLPDPASLIDKSIFEYAKSH